jgi:hypothetical protein
MLIGAHSIIYSKNPDDDREFLRDVLGLPNVDVGDGWMIFGLPPAEVAVHPSAKNNLHEFYLMCDDVEAFVGVHLLRHTFCSHLAMRGAPPRAIQELAGHQDIATTQRYMHLSPAAIDAAIRLLEQPVPRAATDPKRGDISNDVGDVKTHIRRLGRRSRLPQTVSRRRRPCLER